MQSHLQVSSFTGHSVFLLCYLAALGAFGSLVNDLYLPTLPQMRAEFDVSRPVIQLGLSFGMVGLGLGELYWGPLSDKLGRKPVLYISLGVFMLASAISVFSPDITFFLICRLIQGLGGSGAILLARTIPTDQYKGRQLAKIMALVGAINGIAPVGGPLLGGIMADTIGWRGVFTVLTAIAAIMLVAGLRVPESLPVDRRKKGSVCQLMKEFIPLLHNRRFMIHVMLKGSALGALFCYISAGPFIIEEHYGYTAFQFGLIFGANALAIVFGSVLCLRFPTMKMAAVAGTAGMTLFAIAEGTAIYLLDSFWVFEGLIVPMLFCSGIVFASSNTLAMNEGRAEAGSASAILGLGGYVFGCIVSPLVGLGDILLTTSVLLTVCALISLYCGWLSYKLPAMKIQP